MAFLCNTKLSINFSVLNFMPMSLFKSGNPVLGEKTYQDTIFGDILNVEEKMSLRGTMNKFGFLLILLLASSSFSWTYFYVGKDPLPLMIFSVFGGLGLILVMNFKKKWSPYIAPAFALVEGLFVGSASAYYDYQFATKYPGIVFQAVLLTLVTAAVMFTLYRFRIIKATNTFKKVIITATMAIAVFYLVLWIFFLLGFSLPGFVTQGTPLGIAFSVFVVALASLNLILDFDLIENGVANGAPKYMEWFSATALLVTLVWLYLEILRLLAKLNSRK